MCKELGGEKQGLHPKMEHEHYEQVADIEAGGWQKKSEPGRVAGLVALCSTPNIVKQLEIMAGFGWRVHEYSARFPFLHTSVRRARGVASHRTKIHLQ